MKNLKFVTVYPTKKSALLCVAHPNMGALTEDGVSWPLDGFTSRRLTDGSISTDKADAYKDSKDAPKSEPVKSDAAKTEAVKPDASAKPETVKPSDTK